MLPNFRNPCWLEPLPRGFSYDNSYYEECFQQRAHKVRMKKFFGEMEEILELRKAKGTQKSYITEIGIGITRR